MTTTDLISAALDTVRDAHYADLAAGRALCDGPRLVLADILEESGECERAEFIKVQCELANMKPPRGIKARHVGMFGDEVKREFHKHGIRSGWGKRRAWLRRRERELLEANWFSWLPKLDTHAFKLKTPFEALNSRRFPEIEVEFHRGFPSRLRLPRLADWIGRVCERSRRTAATPARIWQARIVLKGVLL